MLVKTVLNYISCDWTSDPKAIKQYLSGFYLSECCPAGEEPAHGSIVHPGLSQAVAVSTHESGLTFSCTLVREGPWSNPGKVLCTTKGCQLPTLYMYCVVHVGWPHSSSCGLVVVESAWPDRLGLSKNNSCCCIEAELEGMFRTPSEHWLSGNASLIHHGYASLQ